MWMIVIVAVVTGKVVYVDSAADSDFFPTEQACEAALTEQFKENSGSEIVKGELADQVFLTIRKDNLIGIRACVETPVSMEQKG